MSLTRLVSSALLLATFQRSYGAVLRGRRPDTVPDSALAAPVRGIDHSVHQVPGHDEEDVNEIIHGPSNDLEELDKRQNSLEVSEEDMRELIDDINAIEGKLQGWLSNGAGNQPEVSDSPPGALTSRTAGPLPTTTGCVVTVTETLYEYVYADVTSLGTGLRSTSEPSPMSATLAATKSASPQGPSASSTTVKPKVTSTPAPEDEGAVEGTGILWQTIALPPG